MKTYLTYKERQEAREAKAKALEAQKNETSEQKAERLGKEAAERAQARANGSKAYVFTPTKDAEGQGRTIVNAPTERPKGKMALKVAKREKVKTLKAAQGRAL